MTSIPDLATELAALRARVERCEAVLAIQELKAAYGELVDRRFSHGAVVDPATLGAVVDEIVQLFTEDAVWDGGPVLGAAVGRDAIAARLLAPTLSFSRHLFVKPHITVADLSASARWDLLCPCRTSDGRSWWMCGYEDDDYRRGDDGRWRMAGMRLTTLVMAETAEGFDRILA